MRLIAIACLLKPAFAAQRARREGGRWRGDADPGGALDLLPAQASNAQQDARLRAEATVDTQNSAQAPSHSNNREPPASSRTEPTSRFTSCGADWDSYEPLHWNKTDGVTHYTACAAASGANVIGICRTDGVGHDSWDQCQDVPTFRCDGIPVYPPAKLFFVLCADVDDPRLATIEAAPPTPAPSLAPTPSPTPAPTVAIEPLSQTPAPTMVASLTNDPHVTNLKGESFDIRMPSSDCTLLRVPHSEEEPELLRLSASMDTDGVRTCGLYVTSVTLSGSLLAHQVVRVRPHTRNAGGSNQAGSETRTNFSLQVGNSSWRDFSHEDMGTEIAEASVGLLRARFLWREELGQRLEAQSLELRVGAGREDRPVLLTLSQAPHQALNLEVGSLGVLGHSRVGGALGTEGRSAALEQPSLGCLRATASPAAGERRGPPVAPASYVSASWH